MFRFIFKMFIGLLSLCTIGNLGESLISYSKGLIKRLTLNNGPCQARPTLGNISSNETHFYLFTVSGNKCGGSCNTIDGLYARVWAQNKTKNTNFIVFDLKAGVHETGFLIQHESCECKRGLNKCACHPNQKWNHNINHCECK